MAELLTFVRRRSKKKDATAQGYSVLSAHDDEGETETQAGKMVEAEDKENVIPNVKGKSQRAKGSSNPDELERRRSSWIGRMLSYSSSAGAGGKLEEQRGGKSKNNNKKTSKKKKKSEGGSYTRRTMPANAAEKKQKAFQQYLQDMKSYFSQVDAYELVEESPSPAKREVLESSHYGNDISYSARRGSTNRRSSIVIRRESIQEYNSSIATDGRLSSAFDKLTTLDTLAEETEAEVPEEGSPSPSSSNENETSAEDNTLVDTLDTIIEDLDIHEHERDEEEGTTKATSTTSIGYHLKQLLSECSQSAAKVQDIPTLDKFIQSQCSGAVSVRKVGEGTFGEAFKLSNSLVLKVVPIDGDVLVNGEKQKTNEELYAEVVIHNCLRRLRNNANNSKDDISSSSSGDNLCDSFIETHGIAVCQGEYAPCLVDAWEKWDECHTSENDHVGMFKSDQLYIVFAYSDGGEDLESFQFRTFDEIRSMLMQVTMGLAVAEEDLKFEHRDLHWGNILLKRTPRSALAQQEQQEQQQQTDDGKMRYVLRGVPIQVETSGLQAQMIDFTLSRLEATTSSSSSSSGERSESDKETFVAFCDLSLDEWLFKGPKGDIQAETYRKMLKRVDKHSQGNWAEFHPQNNVYWLTYLVDCVMMNKLRGSEDEAEVAALSLTSDQNRQLRQFRKACMSANTESCHDLVWHDLFKDCWKITN
jgi:serine/threonine-protein kinase haspin